MGFHAAKTKGFLHQAETAKCPLKIGRFSLSIETSAALPECECAVFETDGRWIAWTELR